MTVTIIKNEIVIPVYRMECGECKSVFTYNYSDLVIPNQNPPFIQCPCCHYSNWHKDRVGG